MSCFEAVGSDELGDGNAGDGGVARQRHHGVAVAAEHEGGDVLDADVELFGDEGAEAGGVEHAGHADDALAVEAGLAIGGLGHGVERVGDDDQDRLGRLRQRPSTTTSDMILKLVLSRSSRLMPGLRGMPAVMMTMSELAVAA